MDKIAKNDEILTNIVDDINHINQSLKDEEKRLAYIQTQIQRTKNNILKLKEA